MQLTGLKCAERLGARQAADNRTRTLLPVASA